MIRLARPADLGLCAVLSCFLLSTTAIAEPPAEPISEEEQLLIGALDDIRGERLDSALETLEALLAKHPNFRLAQMVYADTLLAKVSPSRRLVRPWKVIPVWWTLSRTKR